MLEEELLGADANLPPLVAERARRAAHEYLTVTKGAPWCDREGGCSCGFRNVACSNLKSSPPATPLP